MKQTDTDAQAARLATLHALALDGPARWSAPAFAQALDDPTCFFVPERGASEGFALGRVVVDECELLTLVVDPALRRRGLGLSLLREFEQQARRRGAVRLHLEVAADNGAAVALYRKAGWRISGRRPGYYGDMDALLMGRTPGRPPLPG